MTSAGPLSADIIASKGLVAAKKAVGHSSSETTPKYDRLWKKQVEEVMAHQDFAYDFDVRQYQLIYRRQKKRRIESSAGRSRLYGTRQANMGWEESGIFPLMCFGGRQCLGDSSMVCSLYLGLLCLPPEVLKLNSPLSYDQRQVDPQADSCKSKCSVSGRLIIGSQCHRIER